MLCIISMNIVIVTIRLFTNQFLPFRQQQKYQMISPYLNNT